MVPLKCQHLGIKAIKILKDKFPNIKEPAKEDICYATTNRQMAVKNIAKECDLFFVIGSRNSSNSVRLVEVAKKSGCSKDAAKSCGDKAKTTSPAPKN